MQTASKVILLGKSNVGKTCLIHRYINNVHTDSSKPTIGKYVWPKDEDVRGKSISLQIWDTAGLERFGSLDEMHYRNVVAVILCYDVTDSSSFDRACFWSWQIKERKTSNVKQSDHSMFMFLINVGVDSVIIYVYNYAPMYNIPIEKSHIKLEKGCKVFLCGTKKDLVDDHDMLRMVTSETIQPLVDGLQAAAFEVSSKTGENVEQLFKAVAEYCIQRKEEDEQKNKQNNRNTVELISEKVQPRRGCKC